jgi:hypothetical protein
VYDNYEGCPIPLSEASLFAGFERLAEFGLPDSEVIDVAVAWYPRRLNDTGFLETIVLVCVSGHWATFRYLSNYHPEKSAAAPVNPLFQKGSA